MSSSLRKLSLGLGLSLLFILCYVFMPPFFLPHQDLDIPIYSKSTAREIAKQLRERKVLRFSFPFRALSKLTRADRKLKAGLYRLNSSMSLWEVLTALTSGRSELLALKVPEGYTAQQIALELEGLNVLRAETFLKAVKDPLVLKELGIQGPSLEGFLFPETYRVPLVADAQPLLDLMVRQFFVSAGEGFTARCRRRGYTPYQIVILASIVEKEAQRAEERPIIAGILFNRLQKKMRLQVNAKLNYALNIKNAWLTTEQVNTWTPYNTYLKRGLPPTPICNPGLASLEAALEPARTPYLYYVAQGDGSHLLAVTFEEHEKNIQKAKQILRAKRHQGRT